MDEATGSEQRCRGTGSGHIDGMPQLQVSQVLTTLWPAPKLMLALLPHMKNQRPKHPLFQYAMLDHVCTPHLTPCTILYLCAACCTQVHAATPFLH